MTTRNIRIDRAFVLSDYYTDEMSHITGPKGYFTFIDRRELADEAKKVFGRETQSDLCLKVFYAIPLKGIHPETGVYTETPIAEFKWSLKEKVTVVEATRFQNICSWYGNAPRVYGLVTLEFVDCTLLAQLTEDVGLMHVMEAESVETMNAAWDKIVDIGKEWGYEPVYKEINDGNFWGGGTRAGGEPKWLDFQNFAPTTDGLYERKIAELTLRECEYFSVPLYQTIPELAEAFAEKGVTGWRDCGTRFKDFGLINYPWKGKTYFDIGCDNGMVLNEAHKYGALRTVGCDGKEDIPEYRLSSLKHIQNYVGNWNADLYGVNLKQATTESLRQITGFDQFDVVSFLAMGDHVGHFPQYLFDLTRELLVYEKNKTTLSIPEVMEGLKLLGFARIEHRGETNEANNRDVFIAYK